MHLLGSQALLALWGGWSATGLFVCNTSAFGLEVFLLQNKAQSLQEVRMALSIKLCMTGVMTGQFLLFLVMSCELVMPS